MAYLRKVSVAQLTFVAFLSSEGVTASAAARVDVALLIHRTHRTTAALLRNGNHIFTQMGVDKKRLKVDGTVCFQFPNERIRYLASGHDIVAPVVGGAAVAPLAKRVWRTDTLSGVGVAVIAHVAAVTC